MLSTEIRKKFLRYFQERGHTVVASSPVVPHDDPSLLFVNAGMNQFKDVFLGKSRRDYTRAASAQKCVRVGGKHNDLENVGHTTRHLTFFEMLGNFSFGDYFKKEAIAYGFEVATELFELEVEKIYATVFYEDEEAFELWKKYLPEARIIRMGEKDNFWSMGEVGPCGPCSELLYDRGDAFGPARTPAEDISGERFFEFWNLVFMQHNKTLNGVLEPLPKQSVDTGAGLERVALLKMGVRSLFETDILRSLIAELENQFHIPYTPTQSAPFHVIADHLRTLAFAISDGVQPSNIERGYVLRKVLRRAVRYGRQLGIKTPFLGKLLPRLVALMGEDYPELRTAQNRVEEILYTEEENFLRTLEKGGNLLNQILTKAKESKKISGDDAFKLKDTYGLPLEEILLLAKDAHLPVDILRFEELEKEAKERSKALKKGTAQLADKNTLLQKIAAMQGPTTFVGYETMETAAVVTTLLRNNEEVEALYAGEEGVILLDTTPFYAEKGGQVGDQGTLSSPQGVFTVLDCSSPYPEITFHQGVVQEGMISLGDTLTATVDPTRRQKIANNHTATHLLHYALHKVLGPHVRQAGSVVDATRIRFDFSHHKPLSVKEMTDIEDLVNEKIRENRSVNTYIIPYEEVTKRQEIKQFFGEKYGSIVRLIDIDYSKELCGGTHTAATGSIGYFKLVKESSISAGVRRVEALTGSEAERYVHEKEKELYALAHLLKVQQEQLPAKIEALLTEQQNLENALKESRKKLFSIECENLLAHQEIQNGHPFLIRQLPFTSQELKDFTDLLLTKQKALALFLIVADQNRLFCLARVSKGLPLNASEWMKSVMEATGGKGGGKPDMAQGSIGNGEMLPQALLTARTWIEKHC